MEIPQEILSSRVLIVKPDTELELILSVEYYNSRMELYRRQIRGIIRLERVFLLLNVTLLIAIGVLGIRTGGVFVLKPRIEWLESAALGLFVAAFFWFGLIKRNFIVLTAFSILLIFMDARCGIMAGIDALLATLHFVKLRNVKGKQGYPFFRSIHIERESVKVPDTAENPPIIPDKELP